MAGTRNYWTHITYDHYHYKRHTVIGKIFGHWKEIELDYWLSLGDATDSGVALALRSAAAVKQNYLGEVGDRRKVHSSKLSASIPSI